MNFHVKIWPEDGRVSRFEPGRGLRLVTPAIGSVLPGYSLQVLAEAARCHGVVDESACNGIVPPAHEEAHS